MTEEEKAALAAQEAKEKADKELKERLERIETTQQTSAQEKSILDKLLQDPNIQKVMAANEAGKTVQVGEVDIAPITPDPSTVDFDEMDNKSLFNYMQQINKDQSAEVLLEGLKPVQTVLNQLLLHQQNEERTAIDEEIAAVKAKYPDFEQFKPAMAELYKTSPGLSMEENYGIVKKRSNTSAPESIATELPSQTTVARPMNAQKKGDKLPRGSRGFQLLVQNSDTLTKLAARPTGIHP